MNIEVYNLSINLSDTDIRRLFRPFGIVNSAEVIKDKLNGRSKGKAWVEMPIDAEANQAIVTLNQSFVDGKKITVEAVDSFNYR